MSSTPVHPTKVRYRVTEKAYIDDTLYAASTADTPVFVDFDGRPGTALEPIDEEGRRRKDAYFNGRSRTAEQARAEKKRLTEGDYDAVKAVAPDEPVEPASPAA